VLAEPHAPVRDILRFYADLAGYQKSLLDRPDRWSPGPSGPGSLALAGPEGQGLQTPDARTFRQALDLDAPLAAIPDFLSWLTSRAPERLVEAADALREGDRAEWLRAMEEHLAADAGGQDEPSAVRFVVAAVLQPFAERQAHARASASAGASAGPLCPVCDSPPVAGALRQEGHGARRSLICSLCLTEHDYMRVVCPGCGERKFEALPIYTADQFQHVRIEACDSCRTYLKTIDLTKDGHAIPVVDDIASVSLDVWARDRGYVRLRRNLLGL
jgi:FdhE protein